MKGLLAIFFPPECVPGASNMSAEFETPPIYTTRKCHATAASNSSLLRFKLITQATLVVRGSHMQRLVHAAIHRNLRVYTCTPTRGVFTHNNNNFSVHVPAHGCQACLRDPHLLYINNDRCAFQKRAP